MTPAARVLGLWGSTRLTLFLLESGPGGAPVVRGSRAGPGVQMVVNGDFETALLGALGPWRGTATETPIVLAGAIGSTIGWRTVDYVECPADPRALGPGVRLAAAERAVVIAPGMACVNALGEPDVMRGEELEVAGLLIREPSLAEGRARVCVPGTHAKWIALQDGRITGFLSSATGELFAAVRAGGVLAPRAGDLTAAPGPAFEAGVRLALSDPIHVMHQLFIGRARRVRGLDSDAESLERLSGLLIGADVLGGLTQLAPPGASPPVVVIANAVLGARYARALEMAGQEADVRLSDDLAPVGLWAYASGLGELT